MPAGKIKTFLSVIDNYRMGLPLVSIIVPNYNHSRFLACRVESILAQTFEDYEIIILDDCSTDGSIEVIDCYRKHTKIAVVKQSAVNSGNPFIQWRAGVSLSRGALIWIAESDDSADPLLLEALVAQIGSHAAVGVAYCQSVKIDERGTAVGSWTSHTDDLHPEHWRHDFVASGIAEVSSYLLYRNTIPNASAVLFRKSIYEVVGGVDPSVEKCGDWLLWLKMLTVSDVAFISSELNYFRMHPDSVIARALKISAYYDSIMRDRFDDWLALQRGDPRVASIKVENRRMLVDNLASLARHYWRRGDRLEGLKYKLKECGTRLS